MAQIFALSETDRSDVSAAVSAAEAKSAGEIVTIMAESSDTYHDVALWWSAFAAFVALAVVAWAMLRVSYQLPEEPPPPKLPPPPPQLEPPPPPPLQPEPPPPPRLIPSSALHKMT